MNKLMARIVAAVLAVMMLGTVSFAANLNADNNQIPAEVTSDFNTVWTVKATASDGTIVALYQDNKEPGTIEIDPKKLGNSNYVDVVYSGGNVTEASQMKTVKLYVNKNDNRSNITVAKTITLGEGEDAKTYSNVAFVTNTFSAAGKNISKLGYTLSNGVNSKEFLYDTTLTGGGNITYSVLMYAVPDNVTITADQIFEFIEL